MRTAGRAGTRLGRHCSVVAVLIAVAVTGCSERRSEQYRIQGDSYLRLGKRVEAEESYRNASRANPANLPAKQGLGRCLIMDGKLPEALACFEEAINTSPQSAECYWAAAHLLLRMGKPNEAVALAQRLEGVDAESGGVLHASLLSQTGKPAESSALLTKVCERFPNSAPARMHLAAAALTAGDAAKAEQELKLVLEKLDPGSVGAQMLMVEIANAQGSLATLIDRLSKQAAQNEDQALVLSHALMMAKRVEEGEAAVREALKHDPRDGWASFVLGSHLLGQGRQKEAMLLLDASEDVLPMEAAVARSLAAARTTSAASFHAGTPSVPPAAPAAPATGEDWQSLWRQAALGRLLENRAQYATAEGSHLNETMVLAAFFRGNAALMDELAQKLSPDSPLTAFLKAMRERNPKGVVDALEPWNKQEGELRLMAQNALGYAMGLAGDRAKAVALLSGCRRSFPENGVSLLNLAQVFRAGGMPEFAARALRQLTALYPQNIETQLLLVNVLREAGDHKGARQAAEIAYALFPESREANLTICGVYVDAGELALARTIVDRYLKVHSDDPDMQLALTSVLLRAGNTQEAAEVLGRVPASGDAAARAMVMKALCGTASQEWKSVLDTAGAADPLTLPLPARFCCIAAQLKTGQTQEAIALLKQPEKTEPYGGHPGAVLLQALGQTTVPLSDAESSLSKAIAAKTEIAGDFAAALACQLAQLHDDAYLAYKRVDAAIAGSQDPLLDLLFRSLSRSVRNKDAVQEASSLAEKHAARPKAWLGLATVLEDLGDAAGERDALQKAAEVGKESPEVALSRGNYFLRQKDMNNAISEFRHLLGLRPEDSMASNNLAYCLLLSGGDIQEVLRLAEAAAKGMPRDPRVLHTLGVAQLRTGNLEESRKNLTAALEMLPGTPALLLDYGQLLLAQGKQEEGLRHIDASLLYTRELGLDFDRKAEAEEILAKNRPKSEEKSAPPVPPAST